MEERSLAILEDFDKLKFILERFGQAMQALIQSLVHPKIKPHQIYYRVKERYSLANKISRKADKYSELKEITDLVGVRIVSYFEDDIDTIANILKNEFVIDFANSIDKRDVEADRFGYRSLHYVASLNHTRSGLTENISFKDLKFEVQIRSILQHSWAEMEHDLGYKGEMQMPPGAKRTFYRVSALLEQADIEFVKLKNLIKQYQSTVKQQISTSSSTKPLDASTIIAFIKESLAIKDIENEIANLTCPRLETVISNETIDNVLKKLEQHNITTLFSLEKILIANKREIMDWNLKYFASFGSWTPTSFAAGASLRWLFNVLEHIEPKLETVLNVEKKNK